MNRRDYIMATFGFFTLAAGCITESSFKGNSSEKHDRNQDDKNGHTITETPEILPSCEKPLSSVFIRIVNQGNINHTAKIIVGTVYENDVTFTGSKSDGSVMILEDIIADGGTYNVSVSLADGMKTTYNWKVTDSCDNLLILIQDSGTVDIRILPAL